MSNKSKAAAGLCSWAINIVRYYDVWVTVEPKRRELAQGRRAQSRPTLSMAGLRWWRRLHVHCAMAGQLV
jgi:dynein heavy chain